MTKPKRSYTNLTTEEKWLGLLWLALQIFVMPRLLTLLNGVLPKALTDIGLNFLGYAFQFLATLVIFRKLLIKSLSMAGRHFFVFLQTAVLGFVGWWVSNLVLGWLIRLALPNYVNPNDAAVVQMVQRNFLFALVGTVLLVPMAEECLYRGLVFRGLRDVSRPLAYCLSAALFAAVHVAPYFTAGDIVTTVLAFVQYIPAGLCLAWAFEKSDSLFAPIVIHTAFNAIGIYTVR